MLYLIGKGKVIKMVITKETMKKVKIISAILVTVIVMYSTIQIFLEGTKEYGIALETSNLLKLIGLFFGSIISSIIQNFYLVGALVAILLASRSIRKAKLDETDFEKNKNYFRDIIKNYSISALNYIDKFSLDKKQSYTAKLLELEKKKIIKIENNKIIKISDAIDELDIKFVNSIKDNKITMSLDEYENLIIKEAVSKDLIYQANIFEYIKRNKFFKFMFIIFIASFIFPFIVFMSDFNEAIFLTIIIITVLCSVLISFFVIFIIAYSFNLATDKGYRRTEKGKEINSQLDGLKLFMDEFSNIDKKESKHLVLWEDYLIYSVMFNINKKIQNEYSKFF